MNKIYGQRCQPDSSVKFLDMVPIFMVCALETASVTERFGGASSKSFEFSFQDVNRNKKLETTRRAFPLFPYPLKAKRNVAL
jgi:hypothetical protein